MSENTSDKNIKFLNQVLVIRGAVDQAKEGIAKVVNGGPEGLKAIASVPMGLYSVLHAFENLGTMLTIQQKLIDDLVEENAELMDGLERIAKGLDSQE